MNPALVFTSTLTLIICFLGLFGNILCGIVLVQKEMKSSYIYLLLCLTFSDFLLLALSSLRTLNKFPFFTLHDEIPWIGTSLFILDWICTGGTKYFTVAISLERYFAICHPVTIYRYFSSDRRAKVFSSAVTIFVISLAVISYICKNVDESSFNIYAAIILHFTPFLAVLVLNTIIYVRLRKIQQNRKKLSESELKEVSITKMLIVVVLVFGICYSFEFVRRILAFSGYFDPTKPYYDYTINHLSDLFYVTNSAVNFIIYCLLGRDFRKQFFKLMSKNLCFRKALHTLSPESHTLGESSMDSSATTKYSHSTSQIT